MSRKVAFSAWVLLLVMFVFAVGAFGQTTAAIQGTVSDSSGAVVPGAKVTITGPLGIFRETRTNSEGFYQVPALPPGVYVVKVEKEKFQIQQVKDLLLEVNKNTVQNFSLNVASSSQVVTVEATAPVIETTTVTVGQVINQRTVQDIPLNGRHFVDLALLIPGTVTPPQNGFLTAPLRGQGSFAFNTAGNREDAVNFMINGINLNDMVQNQVTFQPTINTVSEFKVDNSTYSAEYGRNSGAIVNIATRSGTNNYHGELYDYLRNNVFDARNAFNPKLNKDGSAQLQAPFKRNQFGADFGGPIMKDKTFFFLSYEGLRHRQGLPIASTVLSDAQRAQVQAGSNAIAKALLPLIPQANAPANQFLGSVTAPVDIDQGTADISHKIGEADQLHGYYVYQRDLRQETAAGTTIPGFGDTRDGHRQVITVSETHVVNANVVNEARLGANRIHLTFSPNNATDPASLGLAGVLGPNQQFIPTIRLADIGLTFGSERNFPQGRGDTTAVLADTLSYIRGKHSFKFGVEFRDFRNDNFNNDPGQLVFNTTTNFINGNSDSSARTLGNVANRINQNALDFFAQDSWKFTSYLTFELGLRYAWNMTPSEANNRFINFDPTTSSLVATSSPYAQNNKNFQPRLGFSLDVFRNGNTILRGAYAYQVDQPITGIVTGLSSNPPFALPISVGATPLVALGPAYDPNNAANLAPVMVNPDFTNANVQSWNLNIQQQVTKSTALMIGYFGTKGTHLEIDRNINQYTTFGSVGTSAALTRPFQVISPSSQFLPGKTLTTQNITERDSSSNSIYNALWITGNRRMSKNLQFNASYTWSHSIDDASRNNEGLVVQDSNNIGGSRGSSDFDARHRFVVNAIYDVPFQGNRLVSGWEIAPIVSLQSGNPFNVVLATSNITGAANTVRPNVTAPLQISGNPFGQWIANPQVLQAPAPGTLGNLGRNSVVGPNFKNFDLALIKNTKINERFTAQLRADAFNVFNHTNFGQPIPQGGGAGSLVFTPPAPGGTVPASFSTINSTRFPTGDSGSSRQIQLAMRLMF